MNTTKCKQLLLPRPADYDDKFGYSVKFLKPQWRSLLQPFIRYITRDGRYSSIHFYHLRLLVVFKGSKLIIACYLLNSLDKMSCAVKNEVRNREHNLFHHGLIKILVQYQL